jgi:hypothetical protein
MLNDAKLIFTDQEKALELDSKAGSRDGMKRLHEWVPKSIPTSSALAD